MRFFLFSLCIFTLLHSQNVYSQTVDNTAVSENAQLSKTNNKTSPPVSEEHIFESATDEQIEEAQSYYKNCASNEVLSKRKDCKCAASSFLARRLELGDKAPASEIIAQNINTCLINAKENTIKNPDRARIDVTDRQMDEAQAVYDWCSQSAKVRKQKDCECFASEFLKARIESGPLREKGSILVSLKNSCQNIVDMTGAQYSVCMGGVGFTKTYDQVTRKEYCECYAKRWAKLMDTLNNNVSKNKQKSLRRSARMYCYSASAYQDK